MTEKKPSERRTADPTLARAVKALDASNQGVEDALKYVGEGLKGIQRTRRRDRRMNLLVAFMVLTLLLGLAVNAIEGRRARQKLVVQSDTQLETLQRVKAATSPERQAAGQRALAEALKNISCDNQRNIQRAMVNLGADYELTEECR